jgi:hypothetical protein
MGSEFQKPYTKVGMLNAELVTRKSYCQEKVTKWCFCKKCLSIRKDMKRQVNELMGFKFYDDV